MSGAARYWGQDMLAAATRLAAAGGPDKVTIRAVSAAAAPHGAHGLLAAPEAARARDLNTGLMARIAAFAHAVLGSNDPWRRCASTATRVRRCATAAAAPSTSATSRRRSSTLSWALARRGWRAASWWPSVWPSRGVDHERKTERERDAGDLRRHRAAR